MKAIVDGIEKFVAFLKPTGVECDECGAQWSCGHYRVDAHGVKLRKEASQLGWSFDGLKDRCPECKQ